MFCTNCGHELKEGARFCTNCGHPVKASRIRSSMGSDGYSGHSAHSEYGSTSYTTPGTSGSPSSENIFSPENIQRFAPAAAFMPIVSRLLRFILGIIFRTLYTLFPFSYRVIFGFSRFFSIAVGVLTVGCAGLAAAALIHSIVTQGKSDKAQSWIAPIATLLAAISCLGMASWRIHGVLTVLCGIAAAILGLELFARITLAGGQLDSPFDPGAALEIYRNFFGGSRSSSSSTSESDRSSTPGYSGAGRYSGSDGYSGADTRYTSPAEMIMHGGESYFDGSGLELLGYNLLLVLVSAVTCGIAAPWMICKVYNWRLSHTVINGKRLSFNGDGASLLGHWILWEILSVITCGIYGLFVQLNLRKWELEHTFIDGEPMSAGEKASYFDGAALDYLGQSLLTGLLTMVTCGFGTPWAVCMFHTWDASHQVINHRRLTFDGTGGGFFVEYLIIALLTAVTCGIYGSWGTVRMNKYIISHTHFIDSYGTDSAYGA